MESFTSSCPNYATVAEARDSCLGGDFLMWGQYGSDWRVQSAIGSNVTGGPYLCSTCNTASSLGFGYVVGDLNATARSERSSLFFALDVFGDTGCSGTCPCVEGGKQQTSCSALQKQCETSGNGWLTYAQTFESRGGKYMCSGCDLDMHVSLLSGNVLGMEEEASSLTAFPMLVMYGVIIIVLLVATVVDIKVFLRWKAVEGSNDCTGSKSGRASTLIQWRRKYVLYALGYVDHNGNKNTFWSQVCGNHFKCFGYCYCCCCSKFPCIEVFQKTYSWPDIANFLSVFILCLGAGALFGDGELYSFNCYFDGTPSPGETVEETYTRLFQEDFFGARELPEGGLPTFAVSSVDFWVGELVVAVYQFSVNLLTRALLRAGFMEEGKSLLLMITYSMLFCTGAFWYSWGSLRLGILLVNWMTGFVVVLVAIGPFSSALAYLIGKTLIAGGCLDMPTPSKPSTSQAVLA